MRELVEKIVAREASPLRYLVWTAGMALLLAGLVWTSLYSFLLFHGLVEVLTVALGWSIFFLAWNTRHYSDRTGYLIFLGSGYFMVGLVGLLHTLTYKGMNVFPGENANLPTQLWIAARYLEAAALVGTPLVLGRRIRGSLCLAGWGLATALLLWLVFSGRFPDCYAEGMGLTPFKVVSEYSVMAAMLLSALLFLYYRGKRTERVLFLLLGAIAASAGAELAFTLYIGVYDLSNLIGHFLKLLSFWLVYLALVVEGLAQPMKTLFRELTETEAALRAGQDLMREAGNIAHIGGWQLDVETGIITCTDEIRRIIGADPGEELNKSNSLEFYHPDDRETLKRARERALAEGTPYDLELRLMPRGGGTRWVRTNCRVQTTEGRITRLVGVFQDITDQKRAEAMRQDVDRIMRHDLRVPLTASISFPGIIKDEERGLSQDSIHLLDMIEDSGRRMLRMLDMSRDLFKMENGEYQPRLAPVDMVALAGKVLEENGGLVRAKQLETTLSVGGRQALEGDAFMVLGEEILLYTALNNLVLNALEAAPEGTAIEIVMEGVNGKGRIGVHNQGVVPQAVREDFFGKYVTHGKRHGTGLGTYSVRLIVRTLNGDVAMKTSDLEGTVVTMILPLA